MEAIIISSFVQCRPMKQEKVLKQTKLKKMSSKKKMKKGLARKLKFPNKTQQGMSAAIDTAWQKRGFDSLSCEYFWLANKNTLWHV